MEHIRLMFDRLLSMTIAKTIAMHHMQTNTPVNIESTVLSNLGGAVGELEGAGMSGPYTFANRCPDPPQRSVYGLKKKSFPICLDYAWISLALQSKTLSAHKSYSLELPHS